MYMILSNCHMERVSEFYRKSSTCGILQRNLCPGSRAMTKRNTMLSSVLSFRNRLKTTPTLLPPSLMVMSRSFTERPWDEAGRIPVDDVKLTATQVNTSSKQCQISVDFFLTLNSSCVRNFLHQGRPWMETPVARFWGSRGKSFGANDQSNDATISGLYTMTTCPPTRHSLTDSFWLQRKDRHPHPPYLPDLALCNVSYFRKWNWSSRGNFLRALKRSKPNCSA